MSYQLLRFYFIFQCLCLFLLSSATLAEDASEFRFVHAPGKVEIFAGQQSLGTYFYSDPVITRPYFAHVKTLQGTQVTRNHPPLAQDPKDHANLHPGIFLAFGDINGNDYWRLKAKVKHGGFVKRPNQNSFTVRNHYLSAKDNSIVCTEICCYQFTKCSGGYLIDCESTFQSDQSSFYFGDQEEMGLGVRVTSAIREKEGNGRILNSKGTISAKKTWGREAKWCDYSGTIGHNHVGIMIMASPENSRSTWWHNRDYGIFVANLFGRKAMQQGKTSRLIIQPKQSFRLRYGLYIHESPESSAKQLSQIYQQYVNRK